MCVLHFHMSDTADAFAKFPSNPRIEGTPSEEGVVRSHNKGKFSERSFVNYAERNIKQELPEQIVLSTTVSQNEGQPW